MTDARIRLVTRADDAGSCPSANRAIVEAIQHGYVRNVSVMAVCPYVEEAAEMLRPLPDVCIGLHMTLNAEWDEVKWGPVLPADRVPSLVDADGYLHQNPRITHEKGCDADEVLAELAAQLARLRELDLPVAYCDQHMGFGWLPGVAERLEALARREGLLLGRGELSPLPRADGAFDDVGDEVVARLRLTRPGAYLLVGHPGYDEPDMRRFRHEGLAPGEVARQRVREREQFTSPKVAEYARANGVAFVRYSDVLEA